LSLCLCAAQVTGSKLNLIEQLFAKLKALIRGLAPRTREALSSAISGIT
jgi:transposase